MNYQNPSRDDRPPDMPAVSPLDMRTAPEPAQPRRRVAPKSPRQALQPEIAPPPPQRSQKARHPLVVVTNFFLMVVVLVVLAGGAAAYLSMQRFTRAGPLEQQTTVLIERGSSLGTISDQLSRHNVIDSPLVFEMAARFKSLEDRLQAGEYLFEPAVSMQQVLDNLVSGRSVLHAIVFPEGLTSQKVVDRLMADEILTGEVENVPPEGALMPAKYQFTRGATRQQLIDQMQQAQARLVEEAWARRAPGLPIDTIEEFVTLASIVEKETGRADERPRVAGVFINRLEQGMRLQSDPTIIYGIYGGAGQPPDHEILQSELDRQTPYNTYQIAGLPPGPIANPGRAALEAVANPSRTEELYFVADGTGGHAFATTLDEHNRNVERYRRIQALERQQQAEQPAAADGEDTPAPATAEDGEPAEDAAPEEGAAAEEPPAEE
jgi:UPF0755 protein